MGRTLDEVMADLPEDQRQQIEARAAELRREVEGYEALRRLAKLSREQIAQSVGGKRLSADKIENHADLYLSSLRSTVEAAGGTLELRVDLPGKTTLHVKRIADLS